MLVLSRTRDQSIVIGDSVVVTVVDVRGDKVRLGISAPGNLSVHREEVYLDIRNAMDDRPMTLAETVLKDIRRG